MGRFSRYDGKLHQAARPDGVDKILTVYLSLV